MSCSPWTCKIKPTEGSQNLYLPGFGPVSPQTIDIHGPREPGKCHCCTPRLHHTALLRFSENSHKQVLLADMESKQPGRMEEPCPDTPWVPVCPSCPHPPRQCLVGLTPLRGALWNQKVTCATWELSIQEPGWIKSYCHSRELRLEHLSPLASAHPPHKETGKPSACTIKSSKQIAVCSNWRKINKCACHVGIFLLGLFPAASWLWLSKSSRVGLGLASLWGVPLSWSRWAGILNWARLIKDNTSYTN